MNALPDLTTSNTTFLQAALEAMPANEAQATYVRLVARLHPDFSLWCLADLHRAVSEKDRPRVFRVLNLLREAATVLDAQRLITLCQCLDYGLSTHGDWAEARSVVYELEAENYRVLARLSADTEMRLEDFGL
ncbi:MAG: hypothetical protein RMK99_02745 [Anaerolineales bacterium]|nr:hypothetical protein [Anaerolineales bacterium]